MAAIATFALKAGVWFRRGRLLIVSPDSLGTACPLSGRNSTYRPVQILEASSVFDKTQFAEFVHEKAHARSGRANHLRQCFLTKLSHDRLRPAFLAEICKQKEKSGETLFARIK